MKIVYVTPHLSTGGMPEYLRKKVELLKDDNEVWVIEKNFEPAYRTVRDKIENLIGDKLVNLGSNLQKLPNLINSINPDIIHFEELSDYHFTDDILNQIYKQNRSWKIFETLHDSSIDHTEKRFIPDKMLVVSPWQIKNFLPLNIPIEIIQHEIEGGIRDRESGLRKLELDTNKKHILQVGLFSNRKNQSETIELARKLPEVNFHFVGSLTENYSSYWKPLLDNLPSNCKVWGERSDPETFYSCMDMVIFPSRGNYGDRETNPLVIRESISWGVPLLVRDLPFYLGQYNEGDKVKFMSDDIEENKKIINDMLNIETNQTINITEENFFRKKLFNIEFKPEENNKINFTYLEDKPISTKVCVRDIDTEVPIYSFDANFEYKNSYWCVPIPVEYYDFKNNPNFGGFLYDFYVDGEKVYSMTTRIKSTITPKRKFRLETFEPAFVNYEQFFTTKIYEDFFNEVGKIDSVIDVGSNIGLFTELCLDKGAISVICLEINKSAINTFDSLYGQRDNIKLIQKAISDKNGLIEIYEDPENSLISSISKSHGENLSVTNVVESITMDKLFSSENIENVGLLKIDIEGAEYGAFESLSDNNLSKVNSIILEFHDNYGGILRDKILNKLDKNGFTYNLYQADCKSQSYEYEESGTIFALNQKISNK
jgi:FkbM family methyltransferase